jgi:hypothetical protein
MKHIKLFENFKLSGRKILITLSSANSGGELIIDNGSVSLNDVEKAKNWSLGFAQKIDITELCQKIGNKSNEEYAEIISELTDTMKFGDNYRKVTSDIPDDKFDELIEELDELYYNSSEFIKELSTVDKMFEKLDINYKLYFIEYLLSLDFLIVRDSYIYKVIDEGELLDLCNDITERLKLSLN